MRLQMATRTAKGTGPMGCGEERVVPMRLQKFLARAGVASRRGSENLMTAGRVRVNGEVRTELGTKVDPNVDVVTVDDREVRLSERPCYLVLNKPAGYITTMSDPHGRPCVASLVPTERYPGLYAVGRLDFDTTGILLFTTDGDMGQALLHPANHVSKHYVALVEGTPTRGELAQLRAGVVLGDGPCAPAEATVLGRNDPLRRTVTRDGMPAGTCVVGITLREGRKHQVKRMLASVGHKVVRLHRDSFGPLTLRGCAQGSWRMLEEDEVHILEDIKGNTLRW